MIDTWMNRLTAAYLLLFVVSRPAVQGSLLGFLFSGIIPGTDIALPFWAMLIFYLVMISIVIAYFFGGIRKETPAPARTRMPRRRYSHI